MLKIGWLWNLVGQLVSLRLHILLRYDESVHVINAKWQAVLNQDGFNFLLVNGGLPPWIGMRAEQKPSITSNNNFFR